MRRFIFISIYPLISDLSAGYRPESAAGASGEHAEIPVRVAALSCRPRRHLLAADMTDKVTICMEIYKRLMDFSSIFLSETKIFK